MSEPPDLEKEKLDALWGVKSTVPYGNIYFSSTVKGAITEPGLPDCTAIGFPPKRTPPGRSSSSVGIERNAWRNTADLKALRVGRF